MNDTQDFITVHTARNVFEAEGVRQALEEHGIETMVISRQDSALSGLLHVQKGWGQVRVAQDQLQAAQEFLTRLFSDGDYDGESLEAEAMDKENKEEDPEHKGKPGETENRESIRLPLTSLVLLACVIFFAARLYFQVEGVIKELPEADAFDIPVSATLLFLCINQMRLFFRS